MKVFNILYGSIIALLIVAFFTFLGSLAFLYTTKLFATIIFILAIVIGLFIGFFIYREVQKNGAMNVITSVHASPNVDNLKKIDHE